MTAFHGLMQAVQTANNAAGDERLRSDSASYDEWSELLNFVPPMTVQQELRNRDSSWHFNRLDQARGEGVNCDFYGILISSLPTARKRLDKRVLAHGGLL